MDTRIRNCLLTVAALVCLAPALAAQEKTVETPKDVTPETIAAGKKLFGGTGLCSACHGAKAEGGVGPNLIDEEWIHSTGTYDEIVAQILAGVPAGKSKSGIPMPPKGGSSLNEEQVKAVAAYVWSLSHQPAKKAG